MQIAQKQKKERGIKQSRKNGLGNDYEWVITKSRGGQPRKRKKKTKKKKKKQKKKKQRKAN